MTVTKTWRWGEDDLKYSWVDGSKVSGAQLAVLLGGVSKSTARRLYVAGGNTPEGALEELQRRRGDGGSRCGAKIFPNGMTYRQMAEKAGCTEPTISRMIRLHGGNCDAAIADMQRRKAITKANALKKKADPTMISPTEDVHVAHCPKCGVVHKVRMFWAGTGKLRKFCPAHDYIKTIHSNDHYSAGDGR